jgi:hypothetical protein
LSGWSLSGWCSSGWSFSGWLLSGLASSGWFFSRSAAFWWVSSKWIFSSRSWRTPPRSGQFAHLKKKNQTCWIFGNYLYYLERIIQT